MINLTKAPFFLVKEDIEWVENTKKAMTLEEKNRSVICTDRIFRRCRLSGTCYAFTPYRWNHVSVR